MAHSINFFLTRYQSARSSAWQEAVRAGRFPWPAPIGYLNTGNGLLKVDPERASMVRRAFELAAQGSHATDVIRRTLGALGLRTRRGLEIPRQTFLSMLRNELYAGWVCGAGLRIAGKHESIISEKLYADVQRVLDGNGAGGPMPRPKGNPDFPCVDLPVAQRVTVY